MYINPKESIELVFTKKKVLNWSQFENITKQQRFYISIVDACGFRERQRQRQLLADSPFDSPNAIFDSFSTHAIFGNKTEREGERERQPLRRGFRFTKPPLRFAFCFNKHPLRFVSDAGQFREPEREREREHRKRMDRIFSLLICARANTHKPRVFKAHIFSTQNKIHSLFN